MSQDSKKSLGKGSSPPGPVPDGIIRVYSMRFCPFAQRTLLVLKAKGIKHEIININLKNKPEWFFKKNPSGLVPVLETSQGQLICESVITCEYLDETYPKKLFPEDPYKKALQKMILELFSKVPFLSKESYLATKNGKDSSAHKAGLRKVFSSLEEILTHQKTTFLGGNTISMIDYLIWPWFERLGPHGIVDCVDHTPKLKLWIATMKKDPTVIACLTEEKNIQGFLHLYVQDHPEACDYGL